ncbi:MAG: hypothetical protein ACRCX8_16300 [Sarcina sp.]
MEKAKELKLKKITEKVDKLEVNGECCCHDCEQQMWVGNRSGMQSGCKLYIGYNAQTSSWL